ncbi:MAG TPA: GNAT family N-acetyltransferase [Oligoflexus sp.]|uniref:GNAT family N-acetyltransferase n=1 Tax=Oligoflexus sp. TaxID=1971216 RepID=UPI002D476144|nr:GNAT family N-acetyltransferase [Oligoflexus sp.]HYX32673.1 GNAT family N-acetyltransferase [Oligoflexus sp.]
MNEVRAPITYQAPESPLAVSVRSEGSQIFAGPGPRFTMEFAVENGRLRLVRDHQGPERERIHLHVMEFVFGHEPCLQSLDCTDLQAPFHDAFSHRFFQNREGRLMLDREVFFQLPVLWHRRQQETFAPERWIMTHERAHPQRDFVEHGVLYRRYVPTMGQTLSFELLDRQQHLDIFHEWHHQPRVAMFWEMAHPKEQLDDYLSKMEQDPHQRPIMALLDGHPVGYFEVYWTPEDRLGPYYDHDPFDRGFHFLIGDVSVLGGRATPELIQSMVHFIFLDDARTRRVMGEPRSDNAKLLRYVESLPGWVNLREFDFPHKRAALLQNRREDFFRGGSL